MGKVKDLTISYEMTRQPEGSYTGDKMGFSVSYRYEADEEVDLMKTAKELSEQLKKACWLRIHDKMDKKLKEEREQKNDPAANK